jgi:hypothetical protein
MRRAMERREELDQLRLQAGNLFVGTET